MRSRAKHKQAYTQAKAEVRKMQMPIKGQAFKGPKGGKIKGEKTKNRQGPG